MPCKKVPGSPGAVGYWGRSPWERIQAEQTPAKIRALLQDKLVARGQPVWLWLPVTSGTQCTCRKEANLANDRPCPECYGTGFVPGYTRFLHETLFYTASQGDSAATLTDVELDTSFKPNYLRLVNGATTGTLVTDPLPYSNIPGDPWEARSEHYLRAAGNDVTVEYSINGGAAWLPVDGMSPPASVGMMQFRVTLTRAAASDRSPAWSAVRARHVRSQDYNVPQLTNIRGNLETGQILFLRPWIVQQMMSDTGRGAYTEFMGDRSWTAPLDFFDTSITADTPAARIPDEEPGPHPFIEYTSGIKESERIVLTSFKWNEELGIFSHQSFDERRALRNESPYQLVF